MKERLEKQREQLLETMQKSLDGGNYETYSLLTHILKTLNRIISDIGGSV